MAGRIGIITKHINRIVIVRGGVPFKIIVGIMAGKIAITTEVSGRVSGKIFIPPKAVSRIVISVIAKIFKDTGRNLL
jgi:hypothetical protein